MQKQERRHQDNTPMLKTKKQRKRSEYVTLSKLQAGAAWTGYGSMSWTVKSNPTSFSVLE